MRIDSQDKSSKNRPLTQAAQGTSNSAPKTSRLSVATGTAENVSEEDIFARLVNDEMERTQSATGKTSFAELVAKQVKIRTRDDGTVNWEKAMKGALRWASNEKNALLSRDDAQDIYSRSFAASQLDSTSDSLDDATISTAVAKSDTAFSQARITLEKMISGETAAPKRELSERVTSSTTRYSNVKDEEKDTAQDKNNEDLVDVILTTDFTQL